MSDSEATQNEDPSIEVLFLETHGPTVTDRQRYDADTVWTMPRSRAHALALEGVVTYDGAPAPIEPAAPIEPPAPGEAVTDEPDED